jgi:inositol-1,3,4-trisphosphate 5/6-kinase
MQVAHFPAILEAFNNHGGRQLKCYVIGQAVYAAVKPSIPDCSNDNTDVDGHSVLVGSRQCQCQSPFVLQFHSLQSMPKADVRSHGLAGLSSEDAVIVSDIAAFIAKQSGLSLIGFDVIQATATPGLYTVVDVNAFPSFGGLSDPITQPCDDVATSLRKCLAHVMQQASQSARVTESSLSTK